jgi:hypothetical protein
MPGILYQVPVAGPLIREICGVSSFIELSFSGRSRPTIDITPDKWKRPSHRCEEFTMKTIHALTVLTVVNLGILIFNVSHNTTSVQAGGAEQVLRGRALEIIDAEGKVRASISIIPAGPTRRADGSLANDGKISPESALFRLIRPDGRPSVKIETSEQGSALALGGGIDPTYIVMSAVDGDPSLSLTNKSGRSQVVKP